VLPHPLKSTISSYLNIEAVKFLTDKYIYSVRQKEEGISKIIQVSKKTRKNHEGNFITPETK